MYKPKPKKQDDSSGNRLKLPSETGCPAMAKVKFMLEEATNRRGCLVELPWTAGNASFVSTCQWESTVEEPIWTLYQEESTGSKVIWTQSFAPSDLEFMYDILVMSAPKGTSSTRIPELLKPEEEEEERKKKIEELDTEPDMGSENTSGSYPEIAPLPQMGGGIPMPNQSSSNPPSTTPQQSPPPAPPPQQLPPAQPAHPDQSYYQQPPPGYPPPGGYPPPPGYPPHQGYPPPQGYPGYPGQMPPQAPPGYQTQPAYNPYGPAESTNTAGGLVPVDYHLLDKRPNVLLGRLLSDAELISETTLEAALKLQELVREEKIESEKAPSVLKRLHKMGGDIESHLTPQDMIRKSKKKEQAQAPKPQPAAEPADPKAKPKRNLKPAFDLLEKAGILTENDVKDALEVRKKHGGDLVGILEAANKLNRKTVDAAFICLPLIREGLMKSEQ